MKTIDDVSSCQVLKDPASFRSETMGYRGWTPAERELRKPKQGYNQVACRHYIQDSGKCGLQDFMPTPRIVEHNPCVFAEV
jgi:hypothetical protein